LQLSKIVHFEIPADDTTRAREFYSELFGIQWQTYEGPVEYHMFGNEDQQSGGGLMPRQAGQEGLVVYFSTDNIDAASDKVRQLGGSVEDKQPVPGMGWFAHAKDTEGNRFSFWQNDENAPAPDQA
jgi:predicted enzyme related to lactoylglutathione lyase